MRFGCCCKICFLGPKINWRLTNSRSFRADLLSFRLSKVEFLLWVNLKNFSLSRNMADQNPMRKCSDKMKENRENIAGSEETRACLRECFGSEQVDLHRRLSPAVRLERMPSVITQMKRTMTAANGGVLWRPCSTSCAAEAAKMERETAPYPDDTPPNSQPTARRVREGLSIPE